MTTSRKCFVTTLAALAMVLSPLFVSEPALAEASATGAGAPAVAEDGRIHLNFVKWIAGFPHMEGEVEGVPGTFTGEVVSANVSPDGRIVHLEALYSMTWRGRSFTARIKGRQHNENRSAGLDGEIISGWLKGAEVHVGFDIVACPADPRADNQRCFWATMSITPDSGERDNDRESRDDR
jgi:hypothetical protein